MDLLTTSLSFFTACLLAIGVDVLFFSPTPLPSTTLHPSNAKLQEVIKLGEGDLVKPEDVVVDKNGVLYTVNRDGWIKRLHPNNETWENWRWIDSENMYGIAASAAGGIYVGDQTKGLLKVAEDGITVLGNVVNGQKVRWPNDIIEASNGNLYFTVTSTICEVETWFADVLSAKAYGQLLTYDPLLNETSILLHDLAFANGVALSAQQDYLIVCETAKYRCLKYWLKKEIRGKVEVFVDNLPGGPDNINLAPDGTFWIALLQIIPPRQSYLYGSNVFIRLLKTFPKLIPHFNAVYKKAMVVNVDTNGNIIKYLDDPTGKVMSFVTNAMEFEGNLYLASLSCDFIGKLPLRVASP